MNSQSKQSKNPLSFEKMITFNRQYPEARDVYRKMQAWHLKNSTDDGVFFPSSNIISVSPTIAQTALAGVIKKDTFDQMTERTKGITELFWGLHVFGSWRNTLNIYRFNEDIAKNILQSPIPDDTPIGIFTRLPEWCVYIELPKDDCSIEIGVTQGNKTASIDGFWALFDRQDMQGGKNTLNLVLNFNNVSEAEGIGYNRYQPIILLLDDDLTVKESIYRAFENIDNQSRTSDFLYENVFLNTDLKLGISLLSLLLWLCAEEPDISNVVGEPVSKEYIRQHSHRTHPKTGAFISPSAPTVYNLGQRLGGELRSFNERISQSDGRLASRKRPHIRRGHWHGYWRGSGQDKQFFVKWQPAVFVNAD